MFMLQSRNATKEYSLWGSFYVSTLPNTYIDCIVYGFIDIRPQLIPSDSLFVCSIANTIKENGSFA